MDIRINESIRRMELKLQKQQQCMTKNSKSTFVISNTGRRPMRYPLSTKYQDSNSNIIVDEMSEMLNELHFPLIQCAGSDRLAPSTETIIPKKHFYDNGSYTPITTPLKMHKVKLKNQLTGSQLREKELIIRKLKRVARTVEAEFLEAYKKTNIKCGVGLAQSKIPRKIDEAIEKMMASPAYDEAKNLIVINKLPVFYSDNSSSTESENELVRHHSSKNHKSNKRSQSNKTMEDKIEEYYVKHNVEQKPIEAEPKPTNWTKADYQKADNRVLDDGSCEINHDIHESLLFGKSVASDSEIITVPSALKSKDISADTKSLPHLESTKKTETFESIKVNFDHAIDEGGNKIESLKFSLKTGVITDQDCEKFSFNETFLENATFDSMYSDGFDGKKPKSKSGEDKFTSDDPNLKRTITEEVESFVESIIKETGGFSVEMMTAEDECGKVSLKIINDPIDMSAKKNPTDIKNKKQLPSYQTISSMDDDYLENNPVQLSDDSLYSFEEGFNSKTPTIKSQESRTLGKLESSQVFTSKSDTNLFIEDEIEKIIDEALLKLNESTLSFDKSDGEIRSLKSEDKAYIQEEIEKIIKESFEINEMSGAIRTKTDQDVDEDTTDVYYAANCSMLSGLSDEIMSHTQYKTAKEKTMETSTEKTSDETDWKNVANCNINIHRQNQQNDCKNVTKESNFHKSNEITICKVDIQKNHLTVPTKSYKMSPIVCNNTSTSTTNKENDSDFDDSKQPDNEDVDNKNKNAYDSDESTIKYKDPDN